MWDFVLDFLYPKFCLCCQKNAADFLCAKCHSQIPKFQFDRCPICEKMSPWGKTHEKCQKRFNLNGLTVGVDFNNSKVRQLIHAFKYQGDFAVAKSLVNLFLQKKMQALPKDFLANIVITFVPLSAHKAKTRGFNQAEILAKEIGHFLKLPVQPLLSRVKYIKAQMSVKKFKERQENVKSAFEILPYDFPLPKKIILVDDVSTTGSTLEECCLTLKQSGASWVWGVVVARPERK